MPGIISEAEPGTSRSFLVLIAIDNESRQLHRIALPHGRGTRIKPVA
jgi:hypothetical protein